MHYKSTARLLPGVFFIPELSESFTTLLVNNFLYKIDY